MFGMDTPAKYFQSLDIEWDALFYIPAMMLCHEPDVNKTVRITECEVHRKRGVRFAIWAVKRVVEMIIPCQSHEIFCRFAVWRMLVFVCDFV